MNADHLSVAIHAAKAGAHELLRRRDARIVREKGPKDLVTDADLASQQAIQSILLDAFPRYSFVGEEQGEPGAPEFAAVAELGSQPCWIVDPLDGTVNYVHRLQSFAVSIGLFADAKMRLGVIYDPVMDEIFTAIDGQGAQCDGQPIRPSECRDVGQALVACSFPAGVKRTHPEVGRFVNVLEACRSLRRLGSCALNMCYVASGRLDAYWATSIAPWDCAAGVVIARESGAVLTAYDGSAFDDWNPKFCLSATPRLHQAMTTLLTDDRSPNV